MSLFYHALCFSARDWLALIPPTVVLGGISYVSYQTVKAARINSRVNPEIRKDIPKVVDFVDIEDISDKVSLCRCWRSKNVSNLSPNIKIIPTHVVNANVCLLACSHFVKKSNGF